MPRALHLLPVSTLLLLAIEAGGDPGIFCYRMGVDIFSAGRARFFAFAIDVSLISVVVTSLAYSLIAFNPITGLPTNSQRGFDATLALGVAIALVYLWICEAIFGTTIAKLMLGLQVFAVRGGPVGLGRSFVRGLLPLIRGRNWPLGSATPFASIQICVRPPVTRLNAPGR